MNIQAHSSLGEQTEKPDLPLEIVNAENELRILIKSKGLLHKDVQDLYHKVRSRYESILLNDHELVELPDVEYFLWKLHYWHINEYRTSMRHLSSISQITKSGTPKNVAGLQNTIDSHMEGFRSFLSESTEFYQNLITKIRTSYGQPGESLLYKSASTYSTEPSKIDQCQYSCHRFLVCLGDLARYRELCKKLDTQDQNWSIAATDYLQAAAAWPYGGNPHNQLALLATYIGDDFLALYHCVRSLAVKEPFPDAWDNLILLFEKNRSSHFHTESGGAHFDFSNPQEKFSIETNSCLINADLCTNGSVDVEHISRGKVDIWILFVRMISFFLVEFSLEDFNCSFTSTMRELDILLSLDDEKLNASLESYNQINSGREGPYRALQFVSILIFVMHILAENPELKESTVKLNVQPSASIQLASTATFIFMGRLLERCLKYNHQNFCPLLPAVLVFVEWLVGICDKAERFGADEKVSRAISYFFHAFSEVLNRFEIDESELKSPEQPALWEDFELRGFAPISRAHATLNFMGYEDHMGNFDGSASRAYRIFCAALAVVDGCTASKKWILYDRSTRKFFTGELGSFPHQEELEVAESKSVPEKEAHQHACVTSKESEKYVSASSESENCSIGESATVEEEEIILFKPIARYNSAPINTSIIDDQLFMEGTSGQLASSDECLRRATSLFTAPSQSQVDSPRFHYDSNNFRGCKPFKPQESFKDLPSYPTGPPSLSSWVLDKESPHIDKENGSRNFSKHELSTIEEIASESLNGLSISEMRNSIIVSEPVSAVGSGLVCTPLNFLSPPYLTPAPSAPLLPEDAAWFRDYKPTFPEFKRSVGTEAEGILGAAPISGYSNWSAARGPFFIPGGPGLIDPYPPLTGMSSSEWLQQYRNNYNLERANNLVLPHPFVPSGNSSIYHGPDASRFDLCDRWGSPLVPNQMVYLDSPQLLPNSSLVYGADDQRKDKPFLAYQRPTL